MKLSTFLEHWPAACLALAVGLSGCAGGVSLSRREAAGEAQIESVRWQSGSTPVQLVAGPCGRGFCDRRSGACDACGGDGCAIIVPPWLAASHEDTAAELEGGCVARLPWRGVGTCDRPCGPCGVRGGHYAATTGSEYVEISAVDPAPKAKPPARTAQSRSKWLDLFTQRRQGVSRPAPTRYTPPAMPVMPLHGAGPAEQEREPLVTQSDPPAEPRSRVHDTSQFDGDHAGGEIVQTKAETKAPPARSESPTTTTAPTAPVKGAGKILLPSQIAASAAATRPTVRAAQIPVVRPAAEPPRGENPFETRKLAQKPEAVAAEPANQRQRVTTDLVNVDEQTPRSPSARTTSVPANGDRARTESLPSLRTTPPAKLLPAPPARTVVVDIPQANPAADQAKAVESPPQTAPARPAPEKEPVPQVAAQPAPPESRPTIRSTVEQPAARVAEAGVPAPRPAPTAPVVGPPVAATPAAVRGLTPATLVPAYVPDPPRTGLARPAEPAPPEAAPVRASSPEHVVAVGTLQKPDLRKTEPKPAAAPWLSERRAPRHAPTLPPVVMTQRPPEVEVIPVPPPAQPAPSPPPVQAPPASAAPIVIELPRQGERFGSLEALLLVAEHRYASVRTYRARLVQLRAGSPLPVRESLHFRYRKAPQAIIAGTSADPMHGRQAQWAEGSDEWTVVAPVAAGRMKLTLELAEERPLGDGSRPLIECGLGPLLDQLAVHRAAAAAGQGRFDYRGPTQRPEFEQPVHEVVYRTPAESVHYFFDARSFLPVLYELREGESILAYEWYDALEVNVPELEEPLAFDADHQFGL